MESTSRTPPLVTVVIPCLNEESTVGLVVEDATVGFARSQYPVEILVADNGSTDRSRQKAESAGATIVPVKQRGYGAALRHAIQVARGEIVIFGDADRTYDFKEAPTLIDCLQKTDADLVIGSRFKGFIEEGAMPWGHHYLGTPALGFIMKLLFGAKISDSNSGFRAFRAETFRNWNIRSDGMEICSEIILNCLLHGGRIAEVPITLHRGKEGRIPHLSTWRDGMRNLMVIFSRAPHFFTYIGLALVLASGVVAVPSMLTDGAVIGPFSLFEHHSLIFATLLGYLGSQWMFYGLLLDSSTDRPLAINQFLLQIREAYLLVLLGGLMLTTFLFGIFLFTRWVQHHFNHINYLMPGLTVLYCAVVMGSLGFGVLIVQVQKRSPGYTPRRESN